MRLWRRRWHSPGQGTTTPLDAWLDTVEATISLGVRDYVFFDHFEPKNRSETMFTSAQDAKDHADGALINNVMFQIGVSFWIPTSFEYTTFR